LDDFLCQDFGEFLEREVFKLDVLTASEELENLGEARLIQFIITAEHFSHSFLQDHKPDLPLANQPSKYKLKFAIIILHTTYFISHT
jgi:hypothetical protein